MPSDGIDAVISSPPYSVDTVGTQGPTTGGQGLTRGEPCFKKYGDTEGQLGAMDVQPVDAVISSPPFGSGDSASAQSITERTDKSATWVKAHCGPAATQGYGTSPGQMAEMSMQANTFWEAARDVVRECHAILKTGGYAAWIVKRFVRDKQIVLFDEDWRKLCEYCGFETVTEIHASFVKHGVYHGDVGLHGDVLDESSEKKIIL
jgi:hypothetical protein